MLKEPLKPSCHVWDKTFAGDSLLKLIKNMQLLNLQEYLDSSSLDVYLPGKNKFSLFQCYFF